MLFSYVIGSRQLDGKFDGKDTEHRIALPKLPRQNIEKALNQCSFFCGPGISAFKEDHLCQFHSMAKPQWLNVLDKRILIKLATL